MKFFLFVLLAFPLYPISVNALEVPDDGLTHYYSLDGKNIQARRFGDTTYFDVDDGASGVIRHFSGTDFVDYTKNGKNVSGTIQKFGNRSYYDFDNGVTGQSDTIGGRTYYDFSDGASGVLSDF